MTVITHARRKSALGKMIDSAGGVSVGVALTRARKNLEDLRAKAMVELALHINELSELPPPSCPEDFGMRLDGVYRSANAVIDAAAPFELDDICAVTKGLCDIVDTAQARGAMDWRIIEVHVKTLRLLMVLPAEARAERDVVRAQLTDMVARKVNHTG
ncbi:chemotaxis protein CheE [Brevundimonas sp.]|uniref:chemotaxis protein CheE n=1 Tax=Brevundimonas sp. TaxID=1871086 RepID=UPI0035628AB3